MIAFTRNQPLDPNGFKPLARRLRRLSNSDRKAEAAAFLDLYYRENQVNGPGLDERKVQVERELNRFGSYEHTPDELAFGAKVAWRNHAKCIGRLYWRSLIVRDRRDVIDPDQIADEIQQHMHQAYNGGAIKSIISIFAPAKPNAIPAHIEAQQITRYAGYIQKYGSVIGDKANVEATRQAQAAGWQGAGGAFDELPVPIITASGQRLFRSLPQGTSHHIPLKHSDYPEFDNLGLQWYAVPCVSNMILTIGGIDYPCAPFNGFYMSSEIASRNLVDPWRYDLLDQVASTFGFDPKSKDPLWRDRTLTELNAAVLQSYSSAGVTLIDYHRASRDFMKFRADESANGRSIHASWPWIVPPQAASVTKPYHVEMEDESAVPNYYHSWVNDGWRLMPFDGDVSRSRVRGHIRDARRWLIRKIRQPGTFRR